MRLVGSFVARAVILLASVMFNFSSAASSRMPAVSKSVAQPRSTQVNMLVLL